MIVAYAQGGGLGHLTRVRAAAHTLGWTEPITLLTSSPFATDPRVVGDAAVVAVPLELATRADELRAFVRAVLHDLAPSELVVDAFPDGIAGELDASVVPDGVPVTHLARLLQWERYQAVAATPSPLVFDRTWVVEPLHAAHHEALLARSRSIEPLDLVDPPAAVALPDGIEGAWLVVHTGADAEVAELVAYARDLAAAEGVPDVDDRLRVLRPRPPGDPAPPGELDVVPAWPLFPHAARIVTAAGCNLMRQLAPHRPRHHYLPLPRRFDDQPTRAHRARPS